MLPKVPVAVNFTTIFLWTVSSRNIGPFREVQYTNLYGDNTPHKEVKYTYFMNYHKCNLTVNAKSFPTLSTMKLYSFFVLTPPGNTSFRRRLYFTQFLFLIGVY